jgi:hypothetical protein
MRSLNVSPDRSAGLFRESRVLATKYKSLFGVHARDASSRHKRLTVKKKNHVRAMVAGPRNRVDGGFAGELIADAGLWRHDGTLGLEAPVDNWRHWQRRDRMRRQPKSLRATVVAIAISVAMTAKKKVRFIGFFLIGGETADDRTTRPHERPLP